MTNTKREFSALSDTERQKIGEALWRRESPRCQSSLVGELVSENRDGFGIDDIINLTPDPSDWSIVNCREYLRDIGVGSPDPDPWSMDRAALVEALEGASIDSNDDESDDVLREAVIVNIDDETIDGLEEWRDAVRDKGESAEVYEWWEVGSWLAERLEAEGECVIRNGYGDWWGRCCTGQAVYLDNVIQELGYEYAYWALEDK